MSFWSKAGEMTGCTQGNGIGAQFECFMYDKRVSWLQVRITKFSGRLSAHGFLGPLKSLWIVYEMFRIRIVFSDDFRACIYRSIIKLDSFIWIWGTTERLWKYISVLDRQFGKATFYPGGHSSCHGVKILANASCNNIHNNLSLISSPQHTRIIINHF